MEVKKIFIAGIISIILIMTGCTGTSPTLTTTATVTPSPTTVLSQYQIEYELLSHYPDVFWCDPDVYPISREGQEQANSLEQFATIESNQAEFAAILEHLGLTVKSEYTDAEKLSIYREHKKLSLAATLTPAADNSYSFSIRTGENQGLHLTGTIDQSGQIKVQSQEPSFNTCPICLTQGTLIDTPAGIIPVEKIQPGLLVWTQDAGGNRLAVPVIRVSSTPVPPAFQVLRLTLNDGRTVTASPSHPSADRKALSEYSVGDTLDRGWVVSIDRITYAGGFTYDLLPDGDTGFYWANGILLGSTLMK